MGIVMVNYKLCLAEYIVLLRAVADPVPANQFTSYKI
jgi:hypothetical protein